jgi:hypothetical protein
MSFKKTDTALTTVDTLGSLVVILSGMAGMFYILLAGFGHGTVA